ncbi:MAG: DeoR/GlpR family DNA-binding transcription regulator, partial [Planctomycetales bacterium]
ASLPQLAKELDVSESTIRRDLEYLEKTGAAKRTHGGVLYVGPKPGLPHFEERQPDQWVHKQVIAECASKLIEDDDTVLFDGGSTTYEVARRVVGRRLQVVTNSLPVANLFASDANADLVLVGGFVYPRTGVALGPHANAQLSQIHVRKTIMSVGGVTEQGMFNSNLLLVETERAMMAAAEEVIVVADSTKFGHQNLAFLGRLDEIDRLVVDYEITQDWRDKAVAAGIQLTVAEPTDVG